MTAPGNTYAPRWYIVIVTFILAYGSGYAQNASLIGSSGGNVSVRYTTSLYRPDTVYIDSMPFLYFRESELQDGAVSLPTESFLVGIPPTGPVTLEILDEQFGQPIKAKLAPVPHISVSDDSLKSIVRTFGKNHRPGFPTQPRPSAAITEIRWLRYQRVAVIEVSPYNYDGGNLVKRESVTLLLRFAEGRDLYQLSAPADPHFESTYASLLANYDQAKQWRTEPAGPGAYVGTDSTGAWFDPSKEYVRIAVATDGLFRVSYEQLQAANALPLSLSTLTADLFSKGVSIPFRMSDGGDGSFDGGDFLEFYGTALYDSALVRNEFSDTSIFWLTFDGTGANRAVLDTTVVSAPADTVDFSTLTFRMEKDSFYFFGNGGLPFNNQSAKAFGEDWYWRRLLANQTASFPFVARNFHTVGNPLYNISGRLHSPVGNSANPTHDAEVRVNGTIIGSVQFLGSMDTTFSLAASSSLFAEGSNNITITSKPTAATINEFYVDWLEVESERVLAADDDSLLVDGEAFPPGTVALFQLTGFTNENISVYRVGTNGGVDKFFSGSVIGPGPYTMTFTDTISPGARYIALTDAKKQPPSTLAKKTFRNLRSGALGADYLVVTSSELASEAQRLASHRAQQGLGRAEVVLVADIYDEFGFGYFDPRSLRRFFLAIDTLWAAPQPAYVLFFGDANWDYKNNLNGGRRNFVPSLGNPVSDSWLVAPANDAFFPGKKTGRVPVRSLAEAATFVDMVTEYESKPLTRWNKRFLFMTSGFDSVETQRFINFTESLISQRIDPAPISGETARLYKTSPVVDFEQTEEAKRILEEGAVWMNFYGHAGTDFWGNGLSDAIQFVNTEDKRHLISDISCSTVRFAEPLVESFSEKLLFADAGGVVAYLGSSGFGYETPLQIMAREFYRQAAQDTIRELGTLLFNAKVVLRGTGSPSIFSQFALQQMTLLGDPATKILVATKPDLTVDAGGMTTEPVQPTEADPEVKVRIPVRNLGLKTQDSVVVRLVHSIQGEQTVIDARIAPIGLTDTALVLDGAFRRGGAHSVAVTVDPGGLVAEESESNNAAQFTFFVGSAQVISLFPAVSATVNPSGAVLVIQNPGTPATSDWMALFELDTTETFTGSAKISQIVPQGVVTTSWNIPAGLLSDNTHYFWRVRMMSGMDSTGWAASYFLTSTTRSERWIQDRASLFQKSEQSETTVGPDVRLRSIMIPLQVYSAGFDDGNDAAVWVDGFNISQGFSGRGYNIAVLNQYSGVVEFFGAFSIYSSTTDTTLTEPLIQFIQNIPSGRRVIVGVADEGAMNKTERLNKAIESLGSSMIRSLTFRGSWALIGQKGAPIGSVPEGRTVVDGGPVNLADTVLFESIQGSVLSPLIGPALVWSDAGIDVDTSMAGTHVSLDVLRIHRKGFRDTVYNVPITKDSILDALRDSVSMVRLRANLAADSAGASPVISRWWMDFGALPELTSNYQAVRLTADSVLEGEPLVLETDVYNVGTVPAESVQVSVAALENNLAVPFSQAVLPLVSPGGYGTIHASYPTAGRRGRVDVLFQIDPGQTLLESVTVNNTFSYSATVLGDSTPPSFDVTFDGTRIYESDYVKPNPDIRISIRDNSPLPITDPNSVVLRLDGRRVALGAMPDSLFETLTGSEKARVTFRPTLQKGQHALSVQVFDVSGNPADSMEYEIRFNVETDLRLLRVYNFPNPFSSETAFTFHLTGMGIPDDVRLRIYTTAGRLIYERQLYPGEVSIGFNRISWDGRDQNGDPVANGVYFYKVSAVHDGKRVEVIEKLARVR